MGSELGEASENAELSDSILWVGVSGMEPSPCGEGSISEKGGALDLPAAALCVSIPPRPYYPTGLADSPVCNAKHCSYSTNVNTLTISKLTTLTRE